MIASPVRLLPYQRRWVEDRSPLKIAVKARQIGYSFAATLEAVLRCLERRTTWIFLSKGERQARQLMEKVHEHIQACGIVAERHESTFFEGTSVKQLEARLANGSVMIGLPANPETARGYSGNVTLDEFAFHTDADKIYAALYPSITRGYSLEIISTPNGPQGKFYELAKAAGLTEQESGVGSQESEKSGKRQVASDKRTFSLATNHSPLATGWSAHWCDVYEAIRQGLRIDLKMLRAGCDETAWQQEFCCEFVSSAAGWISPELWQMNVSSEASSDFRFPIDDFRLTEGDRPSSIGNRQFFAGWDIARRRDLSVIWLVELVGDVTWVRGVITLKNTPTPDQIQEARGLLPLVRRMAIDQSGMGLAIFEQLQREFPRQVEGVQFTPATKEAMAVRVKGRMEQRLLRLPDSQEIRQSFMALKRAVTAVGLIRFDAEHDARYGHADHFWACALAEAAAERAPTARWREGFLADAPPLINPRAFATIGATWAGMR